MDFFGEFQKREIDGKPYLVYQNILKPQIQKPKSLDEENTIQNPLSIQKLNSFDKVATDSSDYVPLAPRFMCPNLRYQVSVSIDNIEVRNEDGDPIYQLLFKLKTSPLRSDYGDNMPDDHDVRPLFWCSNKEADLMEDCDFCGNDMVGTDYYYCVTCDERYHKECVESPLEIHYPSHVKHSLQIYFSTKTFEYCIVCSKITFSHVYYCALCDIYMHVLCAQATIPFFIDQPKRHDHTLVLFPRQASLTCNVCGMVNKLHLTYVCSKCDFVAHKDCIHIPQTIRISRHHHRISFTSSLPLGEWSCGVCRKEIDRDYGAYTCNMCRGYAVHIRCALRQDIWDGIELEGVPEDGDVEPPFERIADGIILHFSHGCQLKLKTSEVCDQEKFCQACVLPIDEKNFYVCVKCGFILHETCADAPREKYHPLHQHPLKQKVFIVDVEPIFVCQACDRVSNGFIYQCDKPLCHCTLDVVCASVSEPFDYQGHPHPLFLALDPKEKPICHICKSTEFDKVLNCIECHFIICFRCATYPYMVRYKHDEHKLTFCRGDEASDSDWCELCEGKIAIGGEKGFYKCNNCCTTLHINCLLGPHPYMKPGQTILLEDGREMLVQHNNSASRPICGLCNNRCRYPTFAVFTLDMSSSVTCAVIHPYFIM